MFNSYKNMLSYLLLVSIFYIVFCKNSIQEYEKNSEPIHSNVKVRNSSPGCTRDREPPRAIATTPMRCSDHPNRLLTIPEIATLIKNPGHSNFSELAHHLPQFPVPPVPLPQFTFSRSNKSTGIPPPSPISDILSNQRLPFSSIFNSSSLSRPFSQSNPSGTLGKGFGRLVSEISSLISNGSSGPFGSGGILSRNGSRIKRNTGLGIGNTLLHLVGNGTNINSLTNNGGFGKPGNGNVKITISGTVFGNNTPESGAKFNKTITGNTGGSSSGYEGAWQIQVDTNNNSVLISQIPGLGEAFSVNSFPLDNSINNDSTGMNSFGNIEDSGGSAFGINNTPLDSLEVGSDGSVAISVQDGSNANENAGYDTEAENGVLYEDRHMQSPSHTKHVLKSNKDRNKIRKNRSRAQHKVATKTNKRSSSIRKNNPGKKNKSNVAYEYEKHHQ